jgi:hypothetical protein
MTEVCWASVALSEVEVMCQAAYGTVCDAYGQEPDAGNGVAAMAGAVQTFGDLIEPS